MDWIVPALGSTLFVGSYNSFLEGSKKFIPKGFVNKHIYICSILFIVGIIAGLFLLYYKLTHQKEFSTIFKKHITFPYLIVIIPAIILNSYMVTNTLALSGGGGIAMAIINLNMFVTILAGVMLYGDKINTTVIISMLIAIMVISYGVNASMKINK
jgi:drug/metabolite transporter (DMT)-like permease